MTYLIGTDEAGYGPNIGPLVISVTVWEVPDQIRPDTLANHLQNIVTFLPGDIRSDGPRLAIGDSKLLYSSGRGLYHLERGVLSMLGLLHKQPCSWREVFAALCPDALSVAATIPWFADYDAGVPIECEEQEIAGLTEALQVALKAKGVRLSSIRSRVIFESEFNDLIEVCGSKGAALSRETLVLVQKELDFLSEGAVFVVCDKHGGRNRYGELLSELFPDRLVEIYGEGREKSIYRFGPSDRRVEFCFQMKAETCLPVALASMTSKYLRELAMIAFNDFWLQRVEGLRPTAGYPQDARRFRLDIAEELRRLEIEERLLWRVK